ncbi:hypothetical protein WJX84_012198 [Apatococcus fuscideae]|uniref:DNA-(apurinic or apyrimidinic site) endonuclease n=1 Tax=Apatococcus fuscideae TaxID=2026836 RepID=A0AAW1SNJ7_9CHLO
MRILSFNVNGIRAGLARRGEPISELLANLRADIVCFQETKLTRADVNNLRRIGSAEGWEAFYSFCTLRGAYSGTATYCRSAATQPVSAEEGLAGTIPLRSSPASPAAARLGFSSDDPFWSKFTEDELTAIDQQGRCVITDHGAFVLFNLYAPAVTDVLSPRFPYKMHLYEVLKHRADVLLASGRSVVIAGDFNIAPKPIDHCDWHKSSAARQAHFYDNRPDREWFLKLLQEGGGPFLDTYRAFHPPDEHYAYTVWNQATNARKSGNRGSRVDFILVAEPSALEAAQPQDGDAPVQQPADAVIWAGGTVTAAGIDSDFQGSDHCPTWMDVELPQELPQGHATPAMALQHHTAGQKNKLTAWLQTGSKKPLSGPLWRSCYDLAPLDISCAHAGFEGAATTSANSLSGTRAVEKLPVEFHTACTCQAGAYRTDMVCWISMRCRVVGAPNFVPWEWAQ